MQTNSQVNYKAKVILFDMDGTLVDSTPVVERTWQRFANRHGLNIHEILAKSHGRRTHETVALFAPKHVDVEKEAANIIAEEILDTEGVTAILGAKEILEILLPNQWAVVTSAHRELAVRRMLAAGLPMPTFLIAAEDVEQGKPAPDGYLRAAKILQCLPSECIVFEDSPAGINAANSANMKVFAIGNNIKSTKLKYDAWMLDFTNVKVNLPNLFSEQLLITI